MTNEAQATGTTRRIIIDGESGAGSSHIEMERSHIDGKTARLTVAIGGSGTIVHLSDLELRRLVTTSLRLLARPRGE